MNPIDWLNQHVPGFAELTLEEREAIEHFTLLWSLFEARALNFDASCRAIDALARQWIADNWVDFDVFAEPLAYFQDRYFENGVPTRHFEFLNLRPNDQPNRVRAVLSRNNQTPADCLSALLIVVYRLRNNLFHGEKWVYGLRDQRTNFEHASEVLMRALEIEFAAPLP